MDVVMIDKLELTDPEWFGSVDYYVSLIFWLFIIGILFLLLPKNSKRGKDKKYGTMFDLKDSWEYGEWQMYQEYLAGKRVWW